MEVIDNILEVAAFNVVPPVIVLGEKDMSYITSELVNETVVMQRDHVLPSRPAKVKLPILVICGFPSKQAEVFLSGLKASFPQVESL